MSIAGPSCTLIMKVLETESRDSRIKPKLYFDNSLLRMQMEALEDSLCHSAHLNNVLQLTEVIG